MLRDRAPGCASLLLRGQEDAQERERGKGFKFRSALSSCANFVDFWPRNRVLARIPLLSGRDEAYPAEKAQVSKFSGVDTTSKRV